MLNVWTAHRSRRLAIDRLYYGAERCGFFDSLLVIALAISSCADPATDLGQQLDAREKSMHAAEANSSIRSETISLSSAVRPYALIIEHPETRKFLQMFYDLKDGFLIDLPSQTLDDDELARAKIALAPLGVEFESWEVFQYEGGPPAGIQSGFNFSTGPNPEDAAYAAEIIAKQVFQWAEGVRLNFERIDISE